MTDGVNADGNASPASSWAWMDSYSRGRKSLCSVLVGSGGAVATMTATATIHTAITRQG